MISDIGHLDTSLFTDCEVGDVIRSDSTDAVLPLLCITGQPDAAALTLPVFCTGHEAAATADYASPSANTGQAEAFPLLKLGNPA